MSIHRSIVLAVRLFFAVAAMALMIGSGAPPMASAAPISLPSCSGPLAQVHDFVAIDTYSAAEDSRSLTAARERALRSFALQAAACRGTLEVVFDPSEVTTSVLYDGEPGATSAATAIAYARLSTINIDNVVAPTIDRGIAAAERTKAPRDGTPDGVFEILSEDKSGKYLDALVLTDFIEDDPAVDLYDYHPLSVTRAEDLSHLVSVPPLGHALVQIEGVDRTGSGPAPDVWVGAIRAFATALCTKSGATCVVSTQVAP